MPEQIAPNLNLSYGWTPKSGSTPGESGWGDPVSNNFKKLDALVALSVLSANATDPGQTTNGTRYIIAATGATGPFVGRPNQVAVRRSGVWDFYVPPRGLIAEDQSTGRLIKFNGSAWVQATSADLVDALARDQIAQRRIVRAELGQKFPGYDAAFIAAGSPSQGNIYPQGHCFDAAGRVYIKYANGGLAVIAWYTPTYTFGGWFLIAPGGESLVIIDEPGSRKLYSKTGSDRLSVFDITTMPTTGATVAGTDTGLTGVGLQYAYSDNRWIIEQNSADVGGDGSRTKWNIYDKNFAPIGDFYVQKSVVGWQLSSSPLYPYVPKTQGVALRGDKVIFGLGGSYIPEVDGPVAPAVAATGVAVCNLDGTLDSYGVSDAGKLITRFVADGYTCLRMESEGVSLRPTGQISHLLITLRPGATNWTTAGLLLVDELEPSGPSYASIAHPYSPVDLTRLSRGVFPRGPGGGVYNPITGAQFTTMQAVLEFMYEVQLSSVKWYTSAVALTPVDGIVLPTASGVTIENENNTTYIITVTPLTTAGDVKTYRYNLGSPPAFPTSISARSVVIADIDGSANVSAKIRMPHRTETDAEVLFVHQQSTAGGTLLALGGGSSLFYAATRIWMYVTDTLTGKMGVNVAEIFTNGINPGAHLGFDLGTLLKQWREAFIAKLTLSGPSRLGQYTAATLPDAAANTNYVVDQTDALGANKRRKSNGTAWLMDNATAWTTLTLSAGFTAGTTPLQYRIIDDTVEFRGKVVISAALSSGTLRQFAAIPSGFRPSWLANDTDPLRIPISNVTSGIGGHYIHGLRTGVFSVGAAGGMAAGDVLDMSNIRYSL